MARPLSVADLSPLCSSQWLFLDVFVLFEIVIPSILFGVLIITPLYLYNALVLRFYSQVYKQSFFSLRLVKSYDLWISIVHYNGINIRFVVNHCESWPKSYYRFKSTLILNLTMVIQFLPRIRLLPSVSFVYTSFSISWISRMYFTGVLKQNVYGATTKFVV